MLGPQPFSLLQVKRRERKARESALPTILNRARKRITHPPPLSHCSVSFCVLGRAHSCALCAPSGRRGESRRAGDGNPALLLLCSNWPQQPAAASRSDFLLLLSIISERGQAAYIIHHASHHVSQGQLRRHLRDSW